MADPNNHASSGGADADRGAGRWVDRGAGAGDLSPGRGGCRFCFVAACPTVGGEAKQESPRLQRGLAQHAIGHEAGLYQAAQFGGIGIAPGGNINYHTGHAIFEATHGTAPKYANLDKVNPGSVVLSGEMMLRYMGWAEAADLIVKGMNGAIGGKTVTYDFARLMEGAKEVKCSEFGDAVIARM
jgi:hypothetical protein